MLDPKPQLLSWHFVGASMPPRCIGEKVHAGMPVGVISEFCLIMDQQGFIDNSLNVGEM